MALAHWHANKLIPRVCLRVSRVFIKSSSPHVFESKKAKVNIIECGQYSLFSSLVFCFRRVIYGADIYFSRKQ